MDALDVWQGAIDGRNWISKNDVGLETHLVENLGQSKHGTKGIAIGTGVRGQNETWAGAKSLEKCFNLSFVRRLVDRLLEVVPEISRSLPQDLKG